MPRIEPLTPDEIDPVLQDVVAQAQESLPQFMNQVRTLAHQPRIAHDLVTMYLGFREVSTVESRLIELAILTVSHLNRCVYCVSHHAPLGSVAGLSAEALADLEQGVVENSAHFSDLEKLVVAYAEQVTLDAFRQTSLPNSNGISTARNWSS